MTNRCAFLDSEKESCIRFYTITVGISAIDKLLIENETRISHVGVFDARTVTKPSYFACVAAIQGPILPRPRSAFHPLTRSGPR